MSRRSFVLRAVLLCFALLAPAQAQLTSRNGGRIQLLSHTVTAVVEDGLARTTLRQVFTHQGERNLEALYRFPLPPGARLVDVAMEAGGQRYEGLLAERKRARQVYDDIVRTQRDPALVEQVGRQDFRLSVFPVVPREDTAVELTWIEHLPLGDGRFTYSLPLGASGTRVERNLMVSVRLRSSQPLNALEASAKDVEIVRRGEHEALFSLERSKAELDGDLWVAGTVTRVHPGWKVQSYRQEQGDGWFLALWTPPPVRTDQLLPRDVIFVMDTSGSMAEEGKLEHAQRSASLLLDGLRPTDRVNVLRFSTEVEAFAEHPVPATPENRQRVQVFVDGLKPQGSTALGDALAAAGRLEHVPGRVQTVVLLTDGVPTVGEQDPAAILTLAKQAGAAGLRIFTFGAGDELDAGLLRGIAAAGNGESEIFRLGAEIEPRLRRFLRRTASPVVTDVRLQVEGVEAYGLYPRPLPDGYLGEQLAVVGRYRSGGNAILAFEGTLQGTRCKETSVHTLATEPGGEAFVADLYAHQKLDFLERNYRLRKGLTDGAYFAALDRGAYSTRDELVAEMIAVSLEHKVQSAMTSFLVLLPEDRARLAAGDDETVLNEFQLADHNESDLDEEADGVVFDAVSFESVIGVGGGAGGRLGDRSGRRQMRRLAGAGPPVGEGGRIGAQVQRGLVRLRELQGADGHWPVASMPGAKVLVQTARCLLSTSAAGSTVIAGPYRDQLLAGTKALRKAAVDPESYSLQELGLVVCAEVGLYYDAKSPFLKRSAAARLGLLVQAIKRELASDSPRASAAGWAWAVQALVFAEEAKLRHPIETAGLRSFLREQANKHAGYAWATSALIAEILFESKADQRQDMPALTARVRAAGSQTWRDLGDNLPAVALAFHLIQQPWPGLDPLLADLEAAPGKASAADAGAGDTVLWTTHSLLALLASRRFVSLSEVR